MSVQELPDEVLFAKFEHHKKRMYWFILPGLLLAVIGIGFILLVIGFYHAFKLTQVKIELQRRGLIR